MGTLDTTVILRNKQSNYCDGVGRAFDRAKKASTYSVTTQLMVLMLCLYLQCTKNGRGRPSAYGRVLAMVACKAHNLEVGSSNLPSTTISGKVILLVRLTVAIQNYETRTNTWLQEYHPKCGKKLVAELGSDSRYTNFYLPRLWRLDVNISRTFIDTQFNG